jgi:acyl-CoA hydrolase
LPKFPYPDLSAGPLLQAIGAAREVYVSGCAAEITALPQMLGESLPGATVTGILSPLVNEQSYASAAAGRRCRSFFLNAGLKRDLARGLVDLCPWHYGQMIDWVSTGVIFDAAVIMVSPPDDSGCVTLGTQADFLPIFRHRVRRLIAVINPQMPGTRGHQPIPLTAFAAVFVHDRPLLSPRPAAGDADETTQTIAQNVAALIPDRATLQLGIGKIAQAVSRGLEGHRGLRIVSGLIDDDVLRLDDAGALDRAIPITTGVAIGSQALYARLDGNPRFAFSPATATHAAAALAGIDRFHAVNTTLQLDLFGQVNSEMVNGRLISVPGGFPDFQRAARAGISGRAIVALRAGAAGKAGPGIVASLSSPAVVTATKTEVDLVVTEFGLADLRNASLDQRAERLIAIAAPGDRDALMNDWDRIRRRAFGISEPVLSGR